MIKENFYMNIKFHLKCKKRKKKEMKAHKCNKVKVWGEFDPWNKICILHPSIQICGNQLLFHHRDLFLGTDLQN